MKARTILASVLIPLAPMVAPAQLRMREDTRMKVRREASPFNLRDVRLLDGPFRDAMLRDKAFLLSLDRTGSCTTSA